MSIAKRDARVVPSDAHQALLVVENELIRFVKGKRLPSILAFSLLLTIALYSIPLGLGEKYTDTGVQIVYAYPYEDSSHPGYHSYAQLSGRDLVPDSIDIRVNSSKIPKSEWMVLGQGVVLFTTYPNNTALEVRFERAINPIELSTNIMVVLPFMVAVVAVLIGSDAIVGEIQYRTGYLLFPNPVKRSVIFAGKFIACCLVGVAAIAIFYGGMAGFVYATLGSIPKYLLASVGFALLYFLTCLSLSYAISAISKTATGSVVLSFLLLLILFPLMQSIAVRYGVKPWFLPSFAGETITDSLLLGNYPSDIVDLSGSVPYYQFYPDPALSVLVMSITALALCFISATILEKRDLRS